MIVKKLNKRITLLKEKVIIIQHKINHTVKLIIPTKTSICYTY